jgi:hypothetical protein
MVPSTAKCTTNCAFLPMASANTAIPSATPVKPVRPIRPIRLISPIPAIRNAQSAIRNCS